MATKNAVLGCLLGTAVGDAIGLPYEGLSRRRAGRMLGTPDRYRLVFGHGMVSDDTEHNCMVAQALLVSGGEVTSFRRDLGWRLRFWLLGLPAGIGLATLRAILRLCMGFSPERSGVFSAGNGPAMRAAILGAVVDDREQLRQLVLASTRMTHTDPKAAWGALAVAFAARMARQEQPVEAAAYLAEMRIVLGSEGAELLALLERAAVAARDGLDSATFAGSLGQTQGVNGYVMDTVPVATHAWLSHSDDLPAAIMAVIRCGGDTDTTAAITGGIVGARVGKAGVPEAWLAGLCDWPISVRWMENLAHQLEARRQGQAWKPMRSLPFPLIWPRNLVFMGIVLFHGFRRLLPPY